MNIPSDPQALKRRRVCGLSRPAYSRARAWKTRTLAMAELATFAAGCFWGVEARFQNLPGALATQVGYTGGHTQAPTYEDVCEGETGHAEAVEIRFDPAKLSYDKLLAVFFDSHDPTEVNRQGPDMGTQYRSAIFYQSPGQKAAADAAKQVLGQCGRFPRPIVTEIVPAAVFYRAEDYHQKYLEKREG
jgi:peptide-methionine (S)-S-oxide reductase